MRICIYIDGFSYSMTSANPQRGMLRELIPLRVEDHFVLVVRRGSEDTALLHRFLNSLRSRNWELAVEPISRRRMAIRAMLRFEEYCAVSQSANIYLNMDLDYLGSRAKPLVCNVADLSAIFAPRHCSLKWHGVWMRHHGVRMMARHADRIVTVSDFSRTDVERYDPTLRNRITTIHNSIDDEWFHGPPGGEASVNFSHLQNHPYWIWWGYVTRRKNVKGLVRAYAALLRRVPNKNNVPLLLLVGDLGHDSRDLPKLIGELALTGRVIMHSFQPLETLIKLVASSHGLLFPSYYEGFGLPVVEAMALGKPVLVSSRSALPEVGGGLAVVCNPDDQEDFCTALLKMLAPEQHTAAATDGRKKWAAQFTHGQAAEKYSRVVSQVSRMAALRTNMQPEAARP